MEEYEKQYRVAKLSYLQAYVVKLRNIFISYFGAVPFWTVQLFDQNLIFVAKLHNFK